MSTALASSSTTMSLVVAALDDAVPGIRSLSLARPDGADLPSFTAGSHLVLHHAGGANAYSLTGESLAPTAYDVSVLHVPVADGGSGGSDWVHGLRLGDVVTASAPRSAFAPVQQAVRHLLVGAGIGVTPLVSHLRHAARWGRDARLLYLHRPGHGAHLDDLAALDLALGGGRVTVVHDRAAFATALADALGDQPIGTHLYTCGPAGFMDVVTGAARAAGWPDSRVHLEHFGVDALDPGEPFSVTIGGATLPVPSGTSLLDALEAAGHDVPSLCRQGVCGECRIAVTGGTPLHRDLFLTDDEKAAGDVVMCCVSRAEGAHLEVAL